MGTITRTLESIDKARKRLATAGRKAEKLRGEELPGQLAEIPNAPGAGQIRNEIAGMHAAELSNQQLAKLEALRETNPTAYRAIAAMRPNEAALALRTEESVGKLERMMDFLPTAKEISAAAKAGGAKKGWYRASTQALIDVFGDDAPRFAALLASTSPQTSVSENLKNSLNIWKNWQAAGRPTDPAAIDDILARSVSGQRGADSVLTAWRNNAQSALQAEDPLRLKLSGWKVDSFMRNLADDVFAVTNDTHNANLLGVTQTMFGTAPGYNAASALYRQAGDIAGMNPAEMQETGWSFARNLMEKSKKTGRLPSEILAAGDFTDADVFDAPDFSSLLAQPKNAGILTEAGYGPQLAAMQQHPWEVAGRTSVLDRLDPAEREAIMGLTQRTLDEKILQRGRDRFARAYYGADKFGDQMPLTTTFEAAPYAGSGHFPEYFGMSEDARKKFSSDVAAAYQDFNEKDVLHQALGLPAIERRSAGGLWTPKDATTPEQNPAFAASVLAPVNARGQVPIATQRKLNAAEATRAYQTGQGGAGWSGIVPGEEGGYFLDVGARKNNRKLTERELTALQNAATKGGTTDPTFFTQDIGMGAHLLPNEFSATPGVSPEALAQLRQDLSRTVTNPRGGPIKGAAAPYTALPDFKPVGLRKDYLPFEDEWMAEPGSGAVGKAMLRYVDQLSPADRRRLEEAQRGPAGDVLEMYRKKQEGGATVREDLMNALEILRGPNGYEELRKAIAEGRYIAGLAPMGAMGAGATLLPGYGQEQRV